VCRRAVLLVSTPKKRGAHDQVNHEDNDRRYQDHVGEQCRCTDLFAFDTHNGSGVAHQLGHASKVIGFVVRRADSVDKRRAARRVRR
jgi:hypothetical protein